MRKFVLLLAVFLSITSLALAQTTVTGTVKDESGNPVPFATVTEKGTSNAASADAAGAFR